MKMKKSLGILCMTILQTLVRKQHEGRWYLVVVKKAYQTNESEDVKEMQEFVKFAYNAMFFAKIHPTVESTPPTSSWLDEDQRSEEERVKSLHYGR